jgi:hypothetical protein
MSDNSLIYALNQLVFVPGSLGIGTIKDEGKVRIIVSGAGAANVVRIRARIFNQTTWTTLSDLTGNVNELIDIFSYDQMEAICLVFDAANGNDFRIVASSFDGAQLFVTTPAGDLDNISVLNFTSSDNSVTITANPLTDTIDFVAVGGGGGVPDYIDTFNATTDWTGPSFGVYSRTVPFASHAKSSPTIDIFETNGVVEDLVFASVSVDAAYNVLLTVTSAPDLRFAGKLIIS